MVEGIDWVGNKTELNVTYCRVRTSRPPQSLSISGYSGFFLSGHENCECYLFKCNTALSGVFTPVSPLTFSELLQTLKTYVSSRCQFGCAPLWSQLLSDGFSNGTSCQSGSFLARFYRTQPSLRLTAG